MWLYRSGPKPVRGTGQSGPSITRQSQWEGRTVMSSILMGVYEQLLSIAYQNIAQLLSPSLASKNTSELWTGGKWILRLHGNIEMWNKLMPILLVRKVCPDWIKHNWCMCQDFNGKTEMPWVLSLKVETGVYIFYFHIGHTSIRVQQF